jgi:hypothetical protein
MEKLENDDFNFDFQQNNDFQHVSIQVMTNVARAAMSGAIFFDSSPVCRFGARFDLQMSLICDILKDCEGVRNLVFWTCILIVL